MKSAVFFLLLVLCWTNRLRSEDTVLVYTRNYTPDGKGYVHTNIAVSVDAIRKIGDGRHFTVDVSDDPTVFTSQNLKKYRALIFSNSNNVAFDTDEQRQAFRHFIEAGGGFVGIHSASGSERQWDYFAQVLGGRFVGHPVLQTFVVHVADPRSSLVKNVPHDFDWTDECYFLDHLSPGLHILFTTDRKALRGLDQFHVDVSQFPNPLPLAWYQKFDGGREFYLALGHREEEYSDPIFLSILTRGILWTMKR